MLSKKFKDNKTLPIWVMSLIDLLMKLSALSQGQEMILKESPFFTRKSSITYYIRISNTSLVIILPSSLQLQFQTPLREKLLLLLNPFCQELVSDHSFLWLHLKKLPSYASFPILWLESDFSIEILVKVVLVLNHSLISLIIQPDHYWWTSTEKLQK